MEEVNTSLIPASLEGFTCPICTEASTVIDGVPRVALAFIPHCSHTFCVTCIRAWASLKSNPHTCPLCVSPFTTLWVQCPESGDDAINVSNLYFIKEAVIPGSAEELALEIKRLRGELLQIQRRVWLRDQRVRPYDYSVQRGYTGVEGTFFGDDSAAWSHAHGLLYLMLLEDESKTNMHRTVDTCLRRMCFCSCTSFFRNAVRSQEMRLWLENEITLLGTISDDLLPSDKKRAERVIILVGITQSLLEGLTHAEMKRTSRKRRRINFDNVTFGQTSVSPSLTSPELPDGECVCRTRIVKLQDQWSHYLPCSQAMGTFFLAHSLMTLFRLARPSCGVGQNAHLSKVTGMFYERHLKVLIKLEEEWGC